MNNTYTDEPAVARMAQPEALRTGPPVYQGGRIYPCDPVAVARLKRLMEEQRRQKEAAQAARQDKRADTAARLLVAARARKVRLEASAAEEAPIAPARPAGPAAASPARGVAPDTIRALHARHVAGEPVAALAAEVGITRSALGRRFNRMGLKIVRRPAKPPARQSRPRRFAAEELAAAVAAHDAGRLWREIAAEMGTSRAWLRHSLIAAGYEVNGRANRTNSGPAPRLNDEAIRALHARWEAGESSAVLAAEAGVDPQTLRRHCRRLALPTIRVYKRLQLTAGQLAAADAAHDAGRTWREIATEMGVAKTTLRQAVERARQAAGRQPAAPASRLTDEQVATAATQHNQGRTWREIAAEMGVSERTLRRRVSRAGHDMGAPIRRESHTHRYDLTAEAVAAVTAARATGRSWQSIADEQGIDRRTLRSALRRAGSVVVDDRRGVGPRRAARLGEEQVRDLHARRLGGETAAALAAEAGVKVATLRKALAQAGYPPVVLRHGRPTCNLPAADVAAAVAQHEQGRPWSAIAAGLGVSQPTLLKEVRRAGHSTKRVRKGE